MTPEQLAHLTDHERLYVKVCDAIADLLPWYYSFAGVSAHGGGQERMILRSDAAQIEDPPETWGNAGTNTDQRVTRFVAVASRALPAALEALADARRERAWLIEEVTRQTGATSEDVIDCMGVEGHKPVVNLKMDELWKARLAAERERDEARARLATLGRVALTLLSALDAHEDATDNVMGDAYHTDHQDAVYEAKSALRAASVHAPGEDPAPRGVGALFAPYLNGLENGQGIPPIGGFVWWEYPGRWHYESQSDRCACDVRKSADGWRFSWSFWRGDTTEDPWPSGDAATAFDGMVAAFEALKAWDATHVAGAPDAAKGGALGVGPTLFDCRCCGRTVDGFTDGSVTVPGWFYIDNIDGPNAICPDCVDTPNALEFMAADGYSPRIGAERPVVGALGVGVALTNCDSCAHDYVNGTRRRCKLSDSIYDKPHQADLFASLCHWVEDECDDDTAAPLSGATGCPGYSPRGNDPDVTACLALRDAFGLSDPTERKAAWRDFLSAGGTPTPHGYATDATENGDE